MRLNRKRSVLFFLLLFLSNHIFWIQLTFQDQGLSVVFNVSVGWYHLEGLLQTQIVGRYPQSSDSGGLGGAEESTFLRDSQVIPMFLVHTWRTTQINSLVDVSVNVHVEHISFPSISDSFLSSFQCYQLILRANCGLESHAKKQREVLLLAPFQGTGG